VALTVFNIGVEAGQLLFVAGFLAVVWASVRLRPPDLLAVAGGPAPSTWGQTKRLAAPIAYVVGTLASFWLIERTLGFWS
jgi:hypothetical protein